jgi:membrane associated rhomboid family serine protease
MILSLGSFHFIALYLGSGILGSISHIFYERYLKPQLEGRSYSPWKSAHGLGASGSITGMITAFAFLYPNTQFLFMFFIPMPAIAVVGVMLGLDVYRSIQHPNSGVSGAGHIGGFLGGFGYYYWRLKPFIRK